MSDAADGGFYRRRVRYYDPIYHWKDYAGESQRLRELLHAAGAADGARIVEAGCGTGSYLAHLQQWFSVCGFDISPHMVEFAREKLPAITLWEADMAEFTLDEPADALVCLFSSIGYVFPERRLRATADCFARAIRPGGVLIIEPWLEPDVYIDGLRFMHSYDGEHLKLCRMGISGREQRSNVDLAVMDFHWLALEAEAEQPEHFHERHELWLCPRKLMMRIFEDAGFELRLEPDGLTRNRGLIIALRKA